MSATTTQQAATSSKGKVIGFWIATGLVGLGIIASGLANLTHAAPIMESYVKLGLPAYLGTVLGFWKTAGGIAILAPAMPRLKEWAYAGIFFNFSGAVAVHLLNGDPLAQAIAPLFLLVVTVASYLLRPDSRKLEGPAI